jgi:hypothetical protein
VVAGIDAGGSSSTGASGQDTGAEANAGAAGAAGPAGPVDANDEMLDATTSAPDVGTSGGGVDTAPETTASAIDLSIWQLQLPTGSGTSPMTIGPSELTAGFSNAYFYRGATAGQIFMDPATGITTSGSQHCRTELREMTPDGRAAAWPSTGTNTMAVSGRILQVGGGASGHVTVGQVFNGTDSIPLCELEYSVKLGGFQVLYEEGKGAGTTTDLKAPVALGATYTFTLGLTDGALTVGVDGTAVYTKTPSGAVAGKSFYFKAGDYDQTATAGPVSTTPYTVVEIDALDITHR